MSTEPAELLRARGLRVTAQRLAVLRALTDAQHPLTGGHEVNHAGSRHGHRNAHPTADVIADTVRAEMGTISMQAVYDVLNALVDAGLVRRIEPAGHPTRYESRVADNHHHVVCRTCGRIDDIDCAVGEAPCLDAGRASGFAIDEAEVTFWGLCPDCSAPT